METDQKQINKKQQEGFDEETKLKIQAYLEEINQKQQQQNIRYNKTKYIKFASDRERKLLLFTGKFDKKEVPETDFQTGEVVPGKYKTRYSFECYDVTTTPQGENEFQPVNHHNHLSGSVVQQMPVQYYTIFQKTKTF